MRERALMKYTRAELTERASATLLRVTVVQSMSGTRNVRVTWKGRSMSYETPEFVRKDELEGLFHISEKEAAIRAAIYVLEEEIYGDPDRR
uniref:Uncharacterized protein n=1 Tax=uncultured prokaryote TaxID=198431 RepID=A0A0H5QNY7_9ZZZZ|nr:hypothetical protein [uncultured prokaryote]